MSLQKRFGNGGKKDARRKDQNSLLSSFMSSKMDSNAKKGMPPYEEMSSPQGSPKPFSGAKTIPQVQNQFGTSPASVLNITSPRSTSPSSPTLSDFTPAAAIDATWKITNVSRKMMTLNHIESFECNGVHGERYRITIYLNGNNSGNRGFVSVFTRPLGTQAKNQWLYPIKIKYSFLNRKLRENCFSEGLSIFKLDQSSGRNDSKSNWLATSWLGDKESLVELTEDGCGYPRFVRWHDLVQNNCIHEDDSLQLHIEIFENKNAYDEENSNPFLFEPSNEASNAQDVYSESIQQDYLESPHDKALINFPMKCNLSSEEAKAELLARNNAFSDPSETGKKHISQRTIEMYATGEHLWPGFLVDVPGYFYDINESKGLTKNDQKKVENIMRSECNKAGSIILVIYDACALGTGAGLKGVKVARESDLSGERTLGVITKFDRLKDDPTSQARIIKLLKGDYSEEDRLSLPTYGFVAVKGPTEFDCSGESRYPAKTAIEAVKSEQMFWSYLAKENPDIQGLLHSGRLGVQSLSSMLQQVCAKRMHAQLKEFKELVKAEQTSIKLKFEQLPEGAPEEMKARYLLFSKQSAKLGERLENCISRNSVIDRDAADVDELNFSVRVLERLQQFGTDLMSYYEQVLLPQCESKLSLIIKNARGVGMMPELNIAFQHLLQNHWSSVKEKAVTCIEGIHQQLVHLLKQAIESPLPDQDKESSTYFHTYDFGEKPQTETAKLVSLEVLEDAKLEVLERIEELIKCEEKPYQFPMPGQTLHGQTADEHVWHYVKEYPKRVLNNMADTFPKIILRIMLYELPKNIQQEVCETMFNLNSEENGLKLTLSGGVEEQRNAFLSQLESGKNVLHAIEDVEKEIHEQSPIESGLESKDMQEPLVKQEHVDKLNALGSLVRDHVKLAKESNAVGLSTASKLSTPRLVAIGEQSSGKSTVLNMLLGAYALPTDQFMCTRCPIAMTLAPGEGETCFTFPNTS